MPLTLKELEGIQAECFAEDVSIELEKMQLWTMEEATRYFESGGTEEPAHTPTSSAPTPLGRRPRVAILHGTAGNEQIVKMQLGRLLTKIKEFADVFVVEGSLVARDDDPQTVSMKGFFGEKHTFKEYARATADERGWRTYSGLEAAAATVEKAIAALPGGGGADVLIGFSQGANMISCLCGRAGAALAGAAPPFRAAVLLAPANPGWAKQLPKAFANPLTTPTIIAFSDSDKNVNIEAGSGPRNNALLYASGSVRVTQHAGPGHRPLPADKDELAALIDAVVALIKEQCPQ